MSIAQHIPDACKRVSRSLGYALWLDSFDDWQGFSTVIQARLSDRQRAALAYSALRALDHDDAVQTATAALSEGVGQPVAPLFSVMDEALSWANWASPEEHEAYCAVCYGKMPPQRQAAFLKYAQGKAAA